MVENEANVVGMLQMKSNSRNLKKMVRYTLQQKTALPFKAKKAKLLQTKGWILLFYW